MAKVKSPKTIASCPKCRSKDLMDFEGDYFCLESFCNWDSLKMSVERGDLDDALYAYEDMLAKKNANPAPQVDVAATSAVPAVTPFNGSAA